MTKQEIFDKGIKGILAQEAFSYDMDEGQCSYYDENGNRCMLGHLAPNDDIARHWQEELVSSEFIASALGVTEHNKFMQWLQAEHDQIAIDNDHGWNKDDFLATMKTLSRKHNLEWNHENA